MQTQKLFVKSKNQFIVKLICLSVLLLSFCSKIEVNPNPISNINVYNVKGEIQDGEHLDFKKGTFVWVEADDYRNKEEVCFEFHPNEPVYITSSFRVMINNQSYMEKKKKVLVFYRNPKKTPVFNNSVYMIDDTNMPDPSKFQENLNDLYQKNPELLETWNKIGFTSIPKKFFSQAHQLLNFQQQMLDKFLETRPEELNMDMRVEVIKSDISYHLAEYFLDTIFEKDFTNKDPEFTQKIEQVKQEVKTQKKDFMQKMAEDLFDAPNKQEWKKEMEKEPSEQNLTPEMLEDKNNSELATLVDDFRNLAIYFAKKVFRVFLFKSPMFLSYLFAKLERNDNSQPFNFRGMFIQNANPQFLVSEVLNVFSLYFHQLEFDMFDEDLKHFFDEEKQQYIQMNKDGENFEIIENPTGNDYINSAKHALWRLFVKISKKVELRISQQFDISPESLETNFMDSYDWKENGVEFLNLAIRLVGTQTLINIMDKYLVKIRVFMLQMPQIQNQNISPSNLDEKSRVYISHLRSIFVENGEIPFDQEMDKLTVTEESVKVFVPVKDRILLV